MIRLFLLLLILASFNCPAQFTYKLDQNIPVLNEDDQLLNAPWAGGLNAVQYNTMDLNEDGVEDLVLFDRMANKVITFLTQDNKYIPAPEYEIFFPIEITNWLLLRDFNCDGRKDIFTGDILGIKVYRNTTAAGEPISWTQFMFSTGGSTKSPVLLTKGFSGKINLKLEFDDLPSISDADGDGDLDIFNVRFVGNGSVEYHRNYSVERYGTCDSLDFERITQSWGNFKECSCGVLAFNGSDCPTGGRTKHAGGKSLLMLDANGDQKPDLLFSEAACTQLYLLPNEGTLDAPVISSLSAYPPVNPANFLIFPAAFYEDLDFDGTKDLIASPNIFAKENITTNLKESNWFYKNTGTNTNPSFSLVQHNFLQDQMIDVGDNSVPAFIDYDGDGDEDLLVSTNSSARFTSTIHLYENVGSASNASFKLVNNDFLNFSNSDFYNVKIQVKDLDNNNTRDLAFTATDLRFGSTGLYYFLNKSTTSLDVSGQRLGEANFNLTSTENVHLTDVDGDGHVDILAGRSNGALEFWKNDGTGPSFKLESGSFLGIGSSVERQNISAFTADLNGDGKMDLVTGDQSGVLRIIDDYQNQGDNPEQFTEIIFNPLTDSYTQQNLGGRLWPVASNIFNADKPAIVIGNILGGLQILKHDDGSSLSSQLVAEVYPNPIGKTEVLKIRTDRPVTFQILNTVGRQITQPIFIQANNVHDYPLPPLAAGLYLLKFTASGKSSVKRLVVK